MSNIPTPDTKTAGRPKDLLKRAAILKAAKQLFAKQGYSGVSMDVIAAAAKVSKLTVYSHFGDKQTLFTEVVQTQCYEMMPDDLFIPQHDLSIKNQLIHIGHAFFNLVMNEESIATYRMMCSPQNDLVLREMFWKAGPERIQHALETLLTGYVEKGELFIPDVCRAAGQFYALIKGDFHAKLMCGLYQQLQPDKVTAHVEATAVFFLTAYQSPTTLNLLTHNSE